MKLLFTWRPMCFCCVSSVVSPKACTCYYVYHMLFLQRRTLWSRACDKRLWNILGVCQLTQFLRLYLNRCHQYEDAELLLRDSMCDCGCAHVTQMPSEFKPVKCDTECKRYQSSWAISNSDRLRFRVLRDASNPCDFTPFVWDTGSPSDDFLILDETLHSQSFTLASVLELVTGPRWPLLLHTLCMRHRQSHKDFLNSERLLPS